MSVTRRLVSILLGGGLAVSALAAVEIPTAAFADSTCYTGCTPTSPGGGGPPSGAATQGAQGPTTPSSQGGLPFTGADVAELAGIGGTAVVVGGVLLRASRRRRHAAA